MDTQDLCLMSYEKHSFYVYVRIDNLVIASETRISKICGMMDGSKFWYGSHMEAITINFYLRADNSCLLSQGTRFFPNHNSGN